MESHKIVYRTHRNPLVWIKNTLIMSVVFSIPIGYILYFLSNFSEIISYLGTFLFILLTGIYNSYIHKHEWFIIYTDGIEIVSMRRLGKKEHLFLSFDSITHFECHITIKHIAEWIGTITFYTDHKKEYAVQFLWKVKKVYGTIHAHMKNYRTKK